MVAEPGKMQLSILYHLDRRYNIYLLVRQLKARRILHGLVLVTQSTRSRGSSLSTVEYRPNPHSLKSCGQRGGTHLRFELTSRLCPQPMVQFPWDTSHKCELPPSVDYVLFKETGVSAN